MDLFRSYRQTHRQIDLAHFQVMVKETDLDIAIRKDRYNNSIVSMVKQMIINYRELLEDYLARDPEFGKSLVPYKILPEAPAIVRKMADCSAAAGVGPMASVAGVISELIGTELLKYSRDVIVENGGDIFLRSRSKRTIGVYAGKSRFSYRLGIEINPYDTPLGICTSSGTVGHSLSYGCADAVITVSPSVPLADAVATAAANMVKSAEDLENAVIFATSVPNITGAIAILGDKIAIKGRIKLTPL